MLETKSFSRNLHGTRPISCKQCSLGPQPGHQCHHTTISLSLMIGSLQLLPALMISQTSTPQHGPRWLESVSTNSSWMKRTPKLIPKTRRHNHQAKSSFKDYGHNHASYTLVNISSSIFTFHGFPHYHHPHTSHSPPIAVPSSSIGASPPLQHQREKTLLAQPQQQREPSRTEDTHSLSRSNRENHLHQLFNNPTRHASNIPC